ncbi:MAG: hypothetical protein AAFQ65_16255, partial [Myxococcota bacterium]
MSDRLNPVRARTPDFALNTEPGQAVCRVNKPFSNDGVYQPAQTTAVAPAPGMLDGLARLASQHMARLESNVPPGYQTVFRAAAIGLGQNVYETDARLAILAGLETLYSSTDDPRYRAAEAQFAETERSALFAELATFLSSTAAQPVPNEPLERFFVRLSTGLDRHTRLQASNTMTRIRHGSGVSLGAAITRSRDGHGKHAEIVSVRRQRQVTHRRACRRSDRCGRTADAHRQHPRAMDKYFDDVSQWLDMARSRCWG